MSNQDRIDRLEAAICELTEVVGGSLVGNDLHYADPGALARHGQALSTALELYYEHHPRAERSPGNVHGKYDDEESIHNQKGWIWPGAQIGKKRLGRRGLPDFPPDTPLNPDPIAVRRRP